MKAYPMNFDFKPVYPHHDLLIELAQVELAMDRASEDGGGAAPAELESRMDSLREALDHLPV
jgi:hypothetical protein